ncbi:MAG: MBL fold metallo-hydrolase, partial [Proteobacteria bacterium]|nr:MBL fold metallo-hydrolase [Pseudomonadota bacterium]
TVLVGDVELMALQSLGGHVSSQVFLYSADHGLLFSGDYLIDILSLTDRAKSTLSLARTLMTSTNIDSTLFAREMTRLQCLMLETDQALAPKNKRARIFPGHGFFYAVRDADWTVESS